MQVAVWVILFASVFPQRKTQHRRAEQEGEENKTENEQIQRASNAKKSDEETTNEKHEFLPTVGQATTPSLLT